MNIIKEKSVSHIKGFQAIGISAGLKKNGAKDLCLVYSETPAVCSATFTTNIVKAAPVVIDMEHIKSASIRGFITNSGNANACTGQEGYDNCMLMAKATAEGLGIQVEEVMVYSTGVIGQQLPIDDVVKGINVCVEKLMSNGKDGASEAIMTTDTHPKEVFVEVELGGKTVAIAGMAKGSGMVHPNMATMLGYVFTDAAITKEMLTKIHKESIQNSYNMISVDSDTSTNDTATIAANGCAENPIINKENDDYHTLKEAVDYINAELAKMIAADGEGASKLLEANVQGADTEDSAKKCAKAIVSSNLFKAAMFGSDANWGRALCAMGYSGATFDPDKVDVSFTSEKGSVDVFIDGKPLVFDEEKALEILKEEQVFINVNLHDGSFAAKAWGCDLTHGYIDINGSYRS